MLLTFQCCGQDTDGLYEAMEKAIARSEVSFVPIPICSSVTVFPYIVNNIPDHFSLEKFLKMSFLLIVIKHKRLRLQKLPPLTHMQKNKRQPIGLAVIANY